MFPRRRQTAACALLDALGLETPVAAHHAAPHGHWLILVLAVDGTALHTALRATGFDALPSRLAPVVDALAQAVCLPFDPRMTARDLALLGETARGRR